MKECGIAYLLGCRDASRCLIPLPNDNATKDFFSRLADMEVGESCFGVKEFKRVYVIVMRQMENMVEITQEENDKAA